MHEQAPRGTCDIVSICFSSFTCTQNLGAKRQLCGKPFFSVAGNVCDSKYSDVLFPFSVQKGRYNSSMCCLAMVHFSALKDKVQVSSGKQ